MKPGQHGPIEAYLQRAGARVYPISDAYAFLLRARWSTVIALAASVYAVLNALFAWLYWIVPGSIAHTDGSYSEAFFFSVQTFSSIGYGAMASQGTWGNSVMVAEAFVSVFCIATLTGIVFAKFSRPHARVLFSKPMVVETRDGAPTLSFRAANERGNDIVEAAVRVAVLKTAVTKEGRRMRRFYDLPLHRESTPLFSLSWQVFHTIDEQSPLHGMTHDDMLSDDLRFVVSLTGIDGTFAQTIHARHGYWASDVLIGHRFVDVMETLPGGVAQLDFRKFHDTLPEGE